jgi:hypothetical protein
MRTDGDDREYDHLLSEYKIITDEKEHDIQDGIRSAADSISECHPVHDAPERRVGEIQYGFNLTLHVSFVPESCKLQFLVEKHGK